MRREGSWLKARDAVDAHTRLRRELLALILVHLMREMMTRHAATLGALKRRAIDLQLEAPIQMPLDPI